MTKKAKDSTKSSLLTPNRAAIRKQVETLRKEIRKHNKLYYEEDAPEVEDHKYDGWMRELRGLEEQYPELDDPTSPTHTVGGAPKATFEPFAHPLPMYSLENAMDEAALREFFTKREEDLGYGEQDSEKSFKYCLSPKYDGVAVELLYVNGELQTASTRGDGTTGETITHHMAHIPAIPRTLKSIKNIPQSGLGEILIRGEMVMLTSHLNALNETMRMDYEKALAEQLEANAALHQAASLKAETSENVGASAKKNVNPSAKKNEDASVKKNADTPAKLNGTPRLPAVQKLIQFSNPRNATAGGLRQIKSDPSRLSRLVYFAYEIFFSAVAEDVAPTSISSSSARSTPSQFVPPESRYHAFATLHALGFNAASTPKGSAARKKETKPTSTRPYQSTHPHQKYSCLATTIDEVCAWFEKMSTERNQLDFEIDGMVVEIDDRESRSRLGVVGRRPRYAIAWKFPPEIRFTTLSDVRFQVGRTGVITPVGIVEPIVLSGAEVRRVTLHNQNEIARLDLRIGDRVGMTRSGDVIPKILSVDIAARTGDDSSRRPTRSIVFPKNCPTCDHPLAGGKTPEEILIVCVNPACPAKTLRALTHFVSKAGLNIDGVSEKLLGEMTEKGLVTDCSDLYTLTLDSLMTMDRMGEKLAKNILSAIEQSKKTTLQRLIYALGIPGVGTQTALALAYEVQTPKGLLTLTIETLSDLADIGPITAEAVVRFFADPQKESLLERLIERGIEAAPPPPREGLLLSGKTIVFTGTLKRMARRLAKEKAMALGAVVVPSLSEKTTHLVYGEKAGSKLKKAEAMEGEIAIMSEDEFLDLIEEK